MHRCPNNDATIFKARSQLLVSLKHIQRKNTLTLLHNQMDLYSALS